MTMPNFIIIGAAKSGTTALYNYLSQHPEIYMSPRKEPRFFAFEGEKLNFQGPEKQAQVFNQNTITNIEEYQALFYGVSEQKAIGEASPAYLCVPKAAERIKHYIPNVRLIAILRQPAERAYSSFLHTVRNGDEPNTDFAQALREEEKRISNNWEFIWHHKKLGFYYAQLKPYFDKFDHNQIKIYLYEDLTSNPIGLMQAIFQFLGVDQSFTPDMSFKPNVSGIPKSRFLFEFIEKPNRIKDLSRLVIPAKIRRLIMNDMRNKNLAKPRLPLSIKKQMTQEYREDILKLQELIGRDLSKWLE